MIGVPRTRTLDPEPSHAAERHMRESGKLNAQQQTVLAAVVSEPGLTAKEYQRYHRERLGLGPEGLFQRRLKELEMLGLVRRGEARESSVSKVKCATWFPAQNAKSPHREGEGS